MVLWQPGVDPEQVAGLASTRTYPLRSSFRPGYNMAVNLVDRLGVDAARELLEQSFAPVPGRPLRRRAGPADRAQRRGPRGLRRGRCAATSATSPSTRTLRRRVSEREKALARQGIADSREAEAAASLRRLCSPATSSPCPAGGAPGSPWCSTRASRADADPRPLVLTEDRWAGRLSIADFPDAGRRRWAGCGCPSASTTGCPRVRRDLASALREHRHRRAHPGRRRGAAAGAAAEDPELAALRRALRAHPCHGCADREAHARWAERHDRLERETEQLRQKVRATTHSLARAFDRIRALLAERGYLDGESVTADGRRLARLWGESDLLAAECLRHGVWDGLAPADLAAVVSALVYESRRDVGRVPRVPAGAVSAALTATVRLWAELEADERRHRVDRTREPDLGFAWPMHRWARGESLAAVLTAAEQNGAELSAGDFVRWCRQVVDLLDQVADVAGRADGVGRAAADAVTAIRRGVVAVGTA